MRTTMDRKKDQLGGSQVPLPVIAGRQMVQGDTIRCCNDPCRLRTFEVHEARASYGGGAVFLVGCELFDYGHRRWDPIASCRLAEVAEVLPADAPVPPPLDDLHNFQQNQTAGLRVLRTELDGTRGKEWARVGFFSGLKYGPDGLRRLTHVRIHSGHGVCPGRGIHCWAHIKVNDRILRRVNLCCELANELTLTGDDLFFPAWSEGRHHQDAHACEVGPRDDFNVTVERRLEVPFRATFVFQRIGAWAGGAPLLDYADALVAASHAAP